MFSLLFSSLCLFVIFPQLDHLILPLNFYYCYDLFYYFQLLFFKQSFVFTSILLSFHGSNIFLCIQLITQVSFCFWWWGVFFCCFHCTSSRVVLFYLYFVVSFGLCFSCCRLSSTMICDFPLIFKSKSPKSWSQSTVYMQQGWFSRWLDQRVTGLET